MGCNGSKTEKIAPVNPNEHKIVILGEGGVGKSALTFRFVKGEFVEAYNPTIEDAYQQDIKIDDKVITLDILDTAGQEEYRELREIYMNRGEAFLIVYSITDEKSFKNIEDITKETVKIQEHRPPMILVANKTDLEEYRRISKEEGEELAKKLQFDAFFETSACTGLNCSEIFIAIGKLVVDKKKG